MKKIFYFILAAAAIVASCAKEPINEPVSPSGDGSSVFTGTIIQPGGIDEATKVSIIDQTSPSDKVYIKWTSGDQIHIIKRDSEQWNSTSESTKPKVFSAASSEATTEFTGNPPDGWIAPNVTYAARYYGKNAVWMNYVLACDAVTPGDPVEGITINCNSSYVEAAFLENMPLSCEESQYDDSNSRYNFKFSNAYAILQINVPSKLSFEDLYVCVNAQNVEFESGQLKDGSKYTLCLENADAVKSTDKYKNKDHVTYFVPVSAGNYDKLTIVAAKDNAEVARMETYQGYVKNTSDSQYVLPELNSNNIYPFDFCNTKTIEEAGTYSLESNNGIDYKVNIAADITTDVTINAEVEGKEPANIYINNRGHQISGKLTINASKSHVEGENGIATEVEAHTSNSTFVVKSTLTITGLTVKKGSVVVEGTKDNKANVTTITIPEDVTEQIKIDVSGVSSNDENGRVNIVNNSETPVVVVPDDVNDQKSYTVEEGEVTPVSKETVALIGTNTYATFAEALAAATSGDVIEVIAPTVELPELNKEGITVKGNGTTKVTKFGGLTKKNITLDGFEFTVETNPSGENFVIKNSKFTGTNGLRWAYAYGEVLIENCIFDTKTYGIHFDSNTGGIVTVKNCEITGFNTFNPLLIFDNCKFVDSKIDNKYYVVQSWSNIVIKNCSFSEKWCDANDYQTIGLTTETGLAEISNCTFATGTVYDACKNSELGVIAIDATGNTTDGFTAGTFLAKDPTKIPVADGYEYYAIEGKTDIYGIREGFVAKIGETGYATLADAIKAAKSGDEIVILTDLENISATYIPAGVTFNGNGKKISGSSGLYIHANGGAVKNVVFENIHNASNKQSAIYAYSIAGKAEISGCTFDNCDWDAIQITTNSANTDIVIKDNEFKAIEKNDKQNRFIHIQTDNNANVDLKAGITGNKFSGIYNLKNAAIELYCPNDFNKVNITGNYLDGNKISVCIANKENGAWTNHIESAKNWLDAGGQPVAINAAIRADEVAENILLCPTLEVALQESANWAGSLCIQNETALRELSTLVNGGTSFAGKKVSLVNDIDLNNVLFTPIGSMTDKAFDGLLFDGCNHTISNLKIEVGTTGAALFGYMMGNKNGETRLPMLVNLTLKNVDIKSTKNAAAFVAYSPSDCGTIDNCHVDGGTIVSVPHNVGGGFDDGDKVGGIAGQLYGGHTISNCSVKNLSITAFRDLGGVIGHPNGKCYITNNTVENVTIFQSRENAYGTYDTVDEIAGRDKANSELIGNTCTNVVIKRELADGIIYTESANLYEISKVAGLTHFGDMVKGGNSFSGKTVKLLADLDLSDISWVSVGQTGAGQFSGTFDGQNHTISNLSINNTDASDNCATGFFGWLAYATVKNIKVNTANVSGHHNVGVITGYLEGSTIENCSVTGATVSCTHVNDEADGDKCGGIVGYAANANTPVKNCTVSNTTISAGRDAGQVAGAAKEANVTGCSATNVTVTANGTGTGENIRNELIGRIIQ